MSIEIAGFKEPAEVYKEHVGILPPERYNEFAHLLAKIPRPEDLFAGKHRHMTEEAERTYAGSLRGNDIVVGCDIDGVLRAGRVGVVNDKELYLTDGAVDSEYRGLGLAAKMSDKLTDVAKEKGCTYIRADISWHNPINLASYFNNGFVAYAISSPYLLLVRDIDMYDQEQYIMSDETVEIPAAQLKEIGKRFTQGYVAVDVKNAYEGEGGVQMADKTDVNPNHWTIIMRKADPGILPWNRNIQ